MKYSDRPISLPSQDLLGRAEFALAISRGIDRLSVAKDGFVISIQGEWGAGKTSVIELIVRYLGHFEIERCINKFVWEDADLLPNSLRSIEESALLFESVRPKLNQAPYAELDLSRCDIESRVKIFKNWLHSDASAASAERYWRLQQRAMLQPQTIIIRFSPWLIAGRSELASAFLSELARALGQSLGDDVRQAIGQVLGRLSDFAPLVGASLNYGALPGTGAIFGAVGSWSSKVAKTLITGPTLDESREKLRSILEEIEGQKVLVVVDDLDRLALDDAFEMVSLVKSFGDLPNVVYLLSYDGPRLCELIESYIDIDGEDYLKKSYNIQLFCLRLMMTI